ISHHLRGDLHQGNPRSFPSTSMSNMGPRSAPNTSHPTGYGPPSVLEPPTNQDQRTGSASGSPHMSSMGWQSPSQTGMPSPSPANNYVYPEPDPYSTAPGLYYQTTSNIRRPQSTEPATDVYETKPRMNEL